jgi:HEAT repeat protein
MRGVSNLSPKMLSHRDKHMRILAINSIKKCGDEKILSILQHCLSDEDSTVRNVARVALEEIKESG